MHVRKKTKNNIWKIFLGFFRTRAKKYKDHAEKTVTDVSKRAILEFRNKIGEKRNKVEDNIKNLRESLYCLPTR